MVSAGGKLSLEAATGARLDAHSSQESQFGLFSGGGLSITLGSRSQKQSAEDERVFYTGTTLGSLGGDVTLLSGVGYRQMGSNVLAPVGSISITAPTVEIGAVRDSAASRQSSESRQGGLTLALTSPVVDAVRSLQSLTQAASQTNDPRLLALVAATGALTAKNGYDAYNQAPDQMGGVNISLSLGSSRSQSNGAIDSRSVVGSQITAGKDLTIQATSGDLSVIGSSLGAGNNARLSAAGDLNLLGAASTSNSQSSSSGSAASIGIGVALFSNTNGFYVSASASKSSGSSNGQDVAWTNTQVDAGNRLVLESGNDTNLKGAAVSGKQVVADVGGNLNIESLQDSSTYRERSSSVGFSIKIPLYGAGFGGSISGGRTKIDSDYRSVIEQSGIRAGDGGFQIAVAGNTDLKGAVIASTDKAVRDGNNLLVTGTLTTSDIENKAEYSGQSINLGIGYSSPTGGGVGQDGKGNATTGTDQTPGSTLPDLNGWSATPPVVLGAAGNANSVTRSAVSDGTVILTDEAKQKTLTGQDAAATIASLNRDTSNAGGAIAAIFDKNEIQAGFAIAGAFTREVGTFIGNRLNDSERLKQQAAKETDPKKQQAMLLEAYQQELDWGAGGTNRVILTAITAAAGGNVTGGATQMLQGAAVNYLQSLGVEQVKQIADSLKGSDGQPTATSESVRAVLQGIVACAGAAAQNSNCGAGALSAGASVVLNELMKPANDNPASQEARKNIAATLIGGIAAAVGAGNLQTMVNASILETDNNGINLPPAARQALGGALGVAASIASLGEVVKPEFWQAMAILQQSDDKMGLIKMAIEQTVAERQGDYAMFERLSDEFGKGMVAGRSAADVALMADAIASLPVLVTKFVQAGGSLVVNGVKYVQVGGKIVREVEGFKMVVNPSLLNELTSNGVKFTPQNVIATGRNASGQVVFLETGNSTAGLQHIVEGHASDFANIGVSEAQIPSIVMQAVTQGKVVGYQGSGTGRPIYEITINGQPQRIAVTVGDNGFIVGANPAGGAK